MILTAKIKNQTGAWSAQKKYRVNDVAFDGVNYFTNVSGINSALSVTANWLQLTNNAFTPREIDKTAADISASGSDFVIDLAADSMPVLPILLMVYVDINGDGNPLPLQPVNYNPVTKILAGMNSGDDFADQVVKIFVL
jgi:hypothetical protein